ncbi:MAG: tetratricopeptide repeat protein [Elusimicrobiales bacterium]|jgi:tetratricopeptide (TPR) repeat protein
MPPDNILLKIFTIPRPAARERGVKTAAAGLMLFVIPLINCGAGAVETAPALSQAAGYYRLGNASKALETCLAALDKDPFNKDLYAYALEILPDGPSKQAEALRVITNKASARATGEYIYYLGFCKLLRGDGRKPQALSNCKKARTLDPAAWPVYRELGLTYSANGDNARALETLAQGVEISTDNYKAYYYLAAGHERAGNTAGALKNYRKAGELLKHSEELNAAAYAGRVREKINKLAAAPVTPPVKPHVKPAAPAAAVVPSAAPKKIFEICVKEAEGLKRSGDAAAVEKKLAACSALAPREPRIKLDRADYLMRLGKYEEAAGEYRAAAALFGGDGPMTAFCHLKTAQIYFKLNNNPEAVRYYAKALEINKNDLNALLGLAQTHEAAGDLKKAGELYARVLKAEPANAKARERLDEISFELLSNSQLLAQLQFRGAAADNQLSASREDLELLGTIRLAERNGAVDYLRSKTPYTSGLILERQEQDHTGLVLSLAGFKSFLGYLTRDAISFFEKKAISLKDVFLLRDLKGRPLFEPGGRLTKEGMQAYRRAQTGEKAWLTTYEAVPTPEEEKLSAEAEKLIRSGFREISEPEYEWLLKVTDCPDDVLRTPPCDIRLLKMQRGVKYFLCYSERDCRREAVILSTYVERFRAGDTEMSNLTESTAFFGTGAIKKKRFCYQGKIWNGE